MWYYVSSFGFSPVCSLFVPWIWCSWIAGFRHTERGVHKHMLPLSWSSTQYTGYYSCKMSAIFTHCVFETNTKNTQGNITTPQSRRHRVSRQSYRDYAFGNSAKAKDIHKSITLPHRRTLMWIGYAVKSRQKVLLCRSSKTIWAAARTLQGELIPHWKHICNTHQQRRSYSACMDKWNHLLF